MKKIVVCESMTHYIASVVGDRQRMTGVGKSVSAAVGDLVCSHRGFFEIEIESAEDSSPPPKHRQ